ASTDAGPVKHWFAMSNADMEASSSIYVAVLRADGESPLAPESDEEAVASGVEEANGETNGDEEADGEGESDGDEDEDRVQIDFEGLNQRILALPVQTGGYGNLEAGAAGKLYYLRSSPAGRFGGGGGDLVRFDLDGREETVLLSGVVGFSLSADGKKLLYAGQDDFGIADAGGKIDRAKSAIPTDKLTVRIDPRAEWQQIYDEVWRINRDYFYDPGMHGADWAAMAEKYSGFLTDVTSRADLNRVLRWMCSEIAGGGDQRADPERVGGGLLGADFEVADGRYRFAHVLGGLNWNPELRAPLTEPGVSVTTGEYLLAVDGIDLVADHNVFARFENTAGKIVELTVGLSADGSDSRTVSVVPIPNESALRNREWVERNLAKVEEATDGRVAYVYVPNTTTLGHTYFKRYFFPQVHKQALIVDERFNGGGQVADYYIDHLRRPYISHWATRYGADFRTPSAAILGPKVMIIDETAGSGGDLLPWMFNKLGLGTLVGKRTWGGLVGTLGFPVLMDGGFVTAPNLAIWTEDGFVVENVGSGPRTSSPAATRSLRRRSKSSLSSWRRTRPPSRSSHPSPSGLGARAAEPVAGSMPGPSPHLPRKMPVDCAPSGANASGGSFPPPMSNPAFGTGNDTSARHR
ncbi:MAG: PDZ domain-containing protein, partial [Acidobacteria bacterium]|nr:PDZ domain-containing protein [Acidobacteriota bacterium]